MKEIIVDARIIPPQIKHPTIIEQVNKLVIGEDMILINDHDPKPLYYQLQSLFGDVFTWDYVVSGIDNVWKIRIKKKAQFNKTVGEIAVEYPSASTIFHKYKIDFCCGGGRYFADACEERGLDHRQVLREIKETKPATEQPLRFNDWSASSLCDFIVNNHHTYVKKRTPQILDLLDKVTNVHGRTHSQLVKINDTFHDLAGELFSHMEKEENEYFPAVKKYEIDGIYPEKATLEGILEDEHKEAGEALAKIRNLCDDFNPPASACASFELLYSMLHDFESDLHQHIHLENNILFPRMSKPVKFKSCAVK